MVTKISYVNKKQGHSFRNNENFVYLIENF